MDQVKRQEQLIQERMGAQDKHAILQKRLHAHGLTERKFYDSADHSMLTQKKSEREEEKAKNQQKASANQNSAQAVAGTRGRQRINRIGFGGAESGSLGGPRKEEPPAASVPASTPAPPQTSSPAALSSKNSQPPPTDSSEPAAETISPSDTTKFPLSRNTVTGAKTGFTSSNLRAPSSNGNKAEDESQKSAPPKNTFQPVSFNKRAPGTTAGATGPAAPGGNAPTFASSSTAAAAKTPGTTQTAKPFSFANLGQQAKPGNTGNTVNTAKPGANTGIKTFGNVSTIQPKRGGFFSGAAQAGGATPSDATTNTQPRFGTGTMGVSSTTNRFSAPSTNVAANEENNNDDQRTSATDDTSKVPVVFSTEETEQLKPAYFASISRPTAKTTGTKMSPFATQEASPVAHLSGGAKTNFFTPMSMSTRHEEAQVTPLASSVTKMPTRQTNHP